MATGTQEQIEQARETSALARTEKEVSISFGQRTELRELVDRIKAGLPNVSDAPVSGIIALAQAAFAHDLDPWNGEIWLIYNKDKGECSIATGVKGYRKSAKRQMPDREHYYIEFKPIQRGSEDWQRYCLDLKDGYGRDVERAEICILRRSDQMSRYIEQLDKLKAITSSYSEARALAGEPPRFIGIGVVRVGEKTKQERSQTVQNRAEKDAIKKAFDLPFADRTGGGVLVGRVSDDDDDFIEGDYTPTPEPPKPSRPNQVTEDGEIVEAGIDTSATPETPKNGAQDEPESELDKHFGSSRLKRPWSPEGLKHQIDIKVKKSGLQGGISDAQRTKLMLTMNAWFNDQEEPDKFRHTVLKYLRNVDSSSKLTKAEASVLIDWSESADAITEARAVVRQNAVDMGQEDMFKAPLKDAA